MGESSYEGEGLASKEITATAGVAVAAVSAVPANSSNKPYVYVLCFKLSYVLLSSLDLQCKERFFASLRMTSSTFSEAC